MQLSNLLFFCITTIGQGGGMDENNFRSRPYQFVYQYLQKYNARENLDNFSFQKTVHGTPRECLSFLIQWVYTWWWCGQSLGWQ